MTQLQITEHSVPSCVAVRCFFASQLLSSLDTTNHIKRFKPIIVVLTSNVFNPMFINQLKKLKLGRFIMSHI